eukprot:UN07942
MFENFIYGLIFIFHRTFNIQSIKYQAFSLQDKSNFFQVCFIQFDYQSYSSTRTKRTFDFNTGR